MGKDLNNRTLRRHFEVDVAKAFAIVFMVVVHVYAEMSNTGYYHAMPDSLLRNVIEFLGGPPTAPVFMVAMGMGMVMTRHARAKEFMRRGVRLFIAGYALNFFRGTILILIAQASGIDVDTTALDTFLVGDILQFAGLSFLLTGLLKRRAIRPLWILCLALLMQAAGIWGSSYAAHPGLLQMLMRTVLYTGAYSGFPLMLWFVYPASGMVFGEMLKRTGNKDLFYKKTLAVSITMLASMVSYMLRTGYDMRSLYALAEDLYYQQDIYHYLFTLPVVMIAFALCHLLFSGLEQTKLGRFITYSSVNLNAIYVIQWLLVTYTHAFLMLTGIETISVEAVIPIGLLITALSIGICVIWKRVRHMNSRVNCV